MDINKLRIRAEKSKKIEAIKNKIRKELKHHHYALEDRRYETTELLKPVIIAQNEVKDTISQKQDDLINQLDNNQKELIQSVNTLSTTMSNQGSTSGAERWVSDLPSIYDPIEEIEGDEKGDYDDSIFGSVDKEVIKKYGFDPTLKNIPSVKDVRLKIFSANGKSRSKDPIIKKITLSDVDVLRQYLTIVKVKNQNKTNQETPTGSGIKKYIQPRRQAYKVTNGMYGGLMVNQQKLLNEMIVEAHKGG